MRKSSVAERTHSRATQWGTQSKHRLYRNLNTGRALGSYPKTPRAACFSPRGLTKSESDAHHGPTKCESDAHHGCPRGLTATARGSPPYCRVSAVARSGGLAARSVEWGRLGSGGWCVSRTGEWEGSGRSGKTNRTFPRGPVSRVAWRIGRVFEKPVRQRSKNGAGYV